MFPARKTFVSAKRQRVVVPVAAADGGKVRSPFVEAGCSEGEVSDPRDFGALNDRFDDLGCVATKELPRTPSNAASAKAAIAKVGIVPHCRP
jgi:hypothetical protein